MCVKSNARGEWEGESKKRIWTYLRTMENTCAREEKKVVDQASSEMSSRREREKILWFVVQRKKIEKTRTPLRGLFRKFESLRWAGEAFDILSLSFASFRERKFLWAIFFSSSPFLREIFNQHRFEEINLIKWFKRPLFDRAGYIVC